jgi:hypothetical protein
MHTQLRTRRDAPILLRERRDHIELALGLAAIVLAPIVVWLLMMQ